MSEFMLELIIDGKSKKEMLDAIPTTMTVRLWQVDRTQTTTMLAEKAASPTNNMIAR